jgi:hypothetical protein
VGHRRAALEAFCDLERYLASGAEARLDLSEIERESETRGREVVRRCLQAHLDARGDGDVGQAIVVEGADGPMLLSHKRLHTRTVISLFGELRHTRVGYGARGHASVHPLDAELGLPGRCYSYEFQRRLVKAAVCGPFEEAVALMAEMTGVVVPKRSAEQILADAAVDFEAFYAGRASKAPEPEEILVGAIDCKGIPMVKPDGAERVARRTKGQKINKKKMATVAAVFSQAPRVRTATDVIDSLFGETSLHKSERRRRPSHKRVWASLTAGKDGFIADVRAEMDRRDPDHHHTWVMVTDGERALQRRVAASFEGVTLVLDLLHVTEKLWRAAHALHPEGSPEATAFVRERLERILTGRVSQVVKGLRQIVTKRHLSGNKAKALRGAADYLYANRGRMRYDIYLANGWPIASGAVEGTCKTLVRDRLERSGMRWCTTGAEPMLKMRAVYLSGDFDDYWEFHVGQDQERLYPKGAWSVVRK